MPHPGFGFTRRSFHTLQLLACRRRAYLNQIAQVRGRRRTGMTSGLIEGSVWHTLLELFYTPEAQRGQVALRGTDGKPVLSSPKEVLDWYVDRGYPAQAALKVQDAFERYTMRYGNDDDLRDRQICRPEPDIRSEDLRVLLPEERRKGLVRAPYDVGYDMIVRLKGQRGVMAVEHKLLAAARGVTVSGYHYSGQIMGQCATWNANAELVEKYGPMNHVLLNLAFKSDTPFTREEVFVAPQVQADFALQVARQTRDLESTLGRYEKERHVGNRVDGIWPQDGMLRGLCVDFLSPCEFLEVCQGGGRVSSDLYEITEPGRQAAERDKILRVDPSIQEYKLEG